MHISTNVSILEHLVILRSLNDLEKADQYSIQQNWQDVATVSAQYFFWNCVEKLLLREELKKKD